MILAHFAATGDKTPAQGAGVRCTVDLEYDKEQALAWSKEQCRLVVQPETLNVGEFEKLVKARVDGKAFDPSKNLADAPIHPNGFDWITAKQNPVATLAKDLSFLLPEPSVTVVDPAEV